MADDSYPIAKAWRTFEAKVLNDLRLNRKQKALAWFAFYWGATMMVWLVNEVLKQDRAQLDVAMSDFNHEINCFHAKGQRSQHKGPLQ